MFKKLLITLFAIYLLFTPTVNAQDFLARVTYYWTGNITSLGKKLVSGYTIAVDPKIIPYGSKVHIPKMKKTYVASDCGSAVISKKASHGKTIVVDVYCSSKAEADRLIKIYPMWMKISVLK